jgi:uncharacterized C2H2 Zn-finger protein
LSDVAHLLPRCPRCGYGLRLVRGYWWCDVCRVPMGPQKSPSVREAFRLAAESLRRFFAPASPKRATSSYPRSIATLERGPTLARCPSCGALTPREYSYCVHCGTTFGQTVEIPRPTATVTSQLSQHDDAVYQYIVENNGEISLAKASTDLRLTIPELQASIRRLEDSRRIMRDGTRQGGQGVA